MIYKLEEARRFLEECSNRCSVDHYHANRKVLHDENFWKWPGAKKKHHAYEGGLAIHTAQVLDIALSMVHNIHTINRDVLTSACIWHDYLKIKDYALVNGVWEDTEHSQMIYHVAGSAMAYSNEIATDMYSIPEDEVQLVLHCILAHHGQKEWGSPVEPKTPEAAALHYADGMSAQFFGEQQ